MLSICLVASVMLLVAAYGQNTAGKSSPDLGTAAQSAEQAKPAVATSAPAEPTGVQERGSGQPSDTSKKDKEGAEHKTRVRLGGIGVSAGYSNFSGFYPYGPYYSPIGGLYASTLWDPFWGAYAPFYPAGYFGLGQGKGEVKLSVDPKNASVYVDGGYAGTADHLKDIWLEPGAYELRVSAPNRAPFEERIYVLSGKSVKIEAKLGEPKAEEAK
jgi:hypothetical protein